MTEKPDKLNLDFSTSPNVWKFLSDNSFVRGLIGPVGSGKSYACCAEVFKRAVQQKPSPRDGIRYSRFVIVRNSYPMLKTTTIKTWLELFPENIWGGLHWSPPIKHHLKLPSRGNASGIDCEVIFLALDQPKDVRKLLSLELTGAFVNEARELPKAVIDGLTHRVGRYPTKADGGCNFRGIWMDSNPCDDDHWLYRVSEKEKPKGKFAWTFFKQPGGVLEVPLKDVPKEIPEAQGYISAGGKWFKTNPKAENLHNLPEGYYEQLLGGKNLDWVRCYAQGLYTYVQEGKPVWSEYDDSTMTADLEVDENVAVQVGIDFGLTPSAVFAQRMPSGAWHILHEIVTFDMGLDRFTNILKSEMAIRFPKNEFMVWGDPAGQSREGIYEQTSFEFLKTNGILARPTATNDFKVRREAVAMPMNRLIKGKPGFLVNRKCLRLRKSLSGGYHFTRVAVGAGQERFKDKPNKNEHSHVGDALGYCLLGGGEMRRMTRGEKSYGKPTIANTEFNVFA
tara:strand:- start:12123 stop:13643 length:1521 start_codon:yes stop_codon:yes gene_type:complete